MSLYNYIHSATSRLNKHAMTNPKQLLLKNMFSNWAMIVIGAIIAFFLTPLQCRDFDSTVDALRQGPQCVSTIQRSPRVVE